MVKRITYLTKRSDLTDEAFCEYWATTHAEIAKDLPNVTSYRQNRVIHAGESLAGEPYEVDGIVELWFGDEASAGAGFGSEVADRLIEDEPNFLEGLAGAAVLSGDPTPDWPTKVWLLARWQDSLADIQREERVLWLQQMVGEEAKTAEIVVNLLDEGAPRLQRQALKVDVSMPHIAIAIPQKDRSDAAKLLSRLEKRLKEPRKGLQRIQGFVVDELRII